MNTPQFDNPACYFMFFFCCSFGNNTYWPDAGVKGGCSCTGRVAATSGFVSDCMNVMSTCSDPCLFGNTCDFIYEIQRLDNMLIEIVPSHVQSSGLVAFLDYKINFVVWNIVFANQFSLDNYHCFGSVSGHVHSHHLPPQSPPPPPSPHPPPIRIVVAVVIVIVTIIVITLCLQQSPTRLNN